MLLVLPRFSGVTRDVRFMNDIEIFRFIRVVTTVRVLEFLELSRPSRLLRCSSDLEAGF